MKRKKYRLHQGEKSILELSIFHHVFKYDRVSRQAAATKCIPTKISNDHAVDTFFILVAECTLYLEKFSPQNHRHS